MSRVEGHVQISIRDVDGKEKVCRMVRNLVVDDGEKYIANRIATADSTQMTIMTAIAVGTGVSSVVATNTDLGNELFRKAFATGFPENPGGGGVLNQAHFRAQYDPGEATNSQITEAGIFNNAVSGGSMLARITFTPANKATADTMIIDWTLVFTGN